MSEPVSAPRTLAWMREHGDVLRRLVAEEEGDDPTPAPGDDAAIRAHLRFLATALAETAEPGLGARVAGFADDLPEWFDENRDLYEEHLETGIGAIALEEHLQFGVRPGSDPSLDAGLERRVRIGGLIRIFVLGLELRLGPSEDGLEEETLAWMGAHQRELARLIFSLDRHAKASARGPGGEMVDLETQDAIGQAAAVQGHVRLLVEGLASTLARPGPTP
ncbi:MAG: hypothetical protein JHC74_03160 [Thermoleophilia bacterium]|nr:hypothetical protein [Thermoleophilia bacterium]